MNGRGYLILFTALLGILLVGVFDYLTGVQISFSIFYLAPILFATWYGPRRAGVALSIIGAVVWFVLDIVTATGYSHALIPCWNAVVRFMFFFLMSSLLDKLKGKLDLEERMARTDPLTGAHNSRAFYEMTETELSRARRYGHPFSLAYMDVDNFKTVNDTRGHESGDQLLKTIYATLRKNLRASDTIARLGGDELTILFPETNLEEAKVAVEKAHRSLSLKMEQDRWPVSFSIGAVTFSAILPLTAGEMIRAADHLMYEAKKQGKNRALFRYYSATEPSEQSLET